MNMQLAELYMPLAESMARSRSSNLPPNVTVEEIEAAAYYGLADAASKYDPDRGVPFHSYARIRISGEICEFFRGLSWSRPEPEDIPSRDASDTVQTDDFFDFVSSILGERDGKLVRMHYVDGRSLKEIGVVRGVSESRTSQIIKDCHKRLKRALKERL